MDAVTATQAPPAPAARKRLLAAGLWLALTAFSPATQAAMQVILANHSDGTAAFDPHDGPGLDSGPHNGIVRSHDRFQYRLSLLPDGTENDVRLQLTLPAAGTGQAPVQWAYVPGPCRQPGSGLADQGRTLTCLLGDVGGPASTTHYFEAGVMAAARQGDRIMPPRVQVSSATSPVIRSVDQARPLTVSAAPFYDVRLWLPPRNGSAMAPTSGPNGEDGLYHRPLVGLVALNPHHRDRRGVEFLDPSVPIEIELDISGYPPSVRLDDWRIRAGVPANDRPTGGFDDGCGSPDNGNPSRWVGNRILVPYVQDSGPRTSRRPNAVANGGDCRTLSSDRQHVRIALHGVDSTLAHMPSVTDTIPSRPIPSNEFWIANKALVLWTPISDYVPGEPTPHVLRVARVSGTSVSGQPLQGDLPDNNTLHYVRTHHASAVVSRRFVPDSTLVAPQAASAAPGSDSVRQMRPGQAVGVALSYFNNGTLGQDNAYLCEIIDRTAFDIGRNFKATLSGQWRPGGKLQYGARPAGPPHFGSTGSAASEHEPGSDDARSAFDQASCRDGSIRWFNSAAAAEAAGGLVYVRGRIPLLKPNHSFGLQLNGLILRETWAASIAVPGKPGDRREGDSPVAAGTILRGRAEIASDAWPGEPEHSRNHLRVINYQTHARIAQRILAPEAAVRQVPVVGGTTLRYQIDAHYSTSQDPRPETVTITSILPAGLQYVPGSARVGQDAQEPQHLTDTPVPGMSTLRWSLPGRSPWLGSIDDDRALLPRIEFEARVGHAVRNGSRLRALATIDGGPHDADPDCRFEPARQDFDDCVRRAASDVRTLSPSGFSLEIHTPRTTIEPGEGFEQEIRMLPAGQDMVAPELPDIIDILPFPGDGEARPATGFRGRSPASVFEPGALRLHGVSPPAQDPAARILYTLRPPQEVHADPQHDSNRPGSGATRWCPAAELGSSGCPASIGDSTAVRISPALATLPAGQAYAVTLHFRTDPLLARPGSRFSHHAGARAADPGTGQPHVESRGDLPVLVSIAMSRLSGRSFIDHGQDGRFDPEDTPVAGQCISLAGTGRKGQQFSYSTRTDEQGAHDFAEGARDRIHVGSDCSGTPLRNFIGLMPGDYTLSRSQDIAAPRRQAGLLHAGSAGGEATGHRIRNIRLDPGTHAQGYLLTEAMIPPRLTLRATVDNRHGGQLGAGEIRLHATPTAAAGNPNPVLSGHGGSAALSDATLPAGAYTLAHTPVPGYRAGAWQCVLDGRQDTSSGTPLVLDHGDRATCTLPLHDLPARLTLLNTLDIRHGRQADISNFLLQAHGSDPQHPALSGVGGTPAVSGIELPAGRYHLSSRAPEHFQPGPWRCVVDTADGRTVSPELVDALLPLGNGDEARCSITHTDAPLRLSLDLVSVDDAPGSSLPIPDSAPAVLHVIPVGEPSRRILLRAGEAASEALVAGAEYELLAPERRGYRTRLHCYGADNRLLPMIGSRLRLGENTGCRIIFTRIPTTMSLSQSIDGGIRPVNGSRQDHDIDYLLRVRHEGGADGHYDLLDLPGFDPDVQIIDIRATRNGRPLPLSAVTSADGLRHWVLAEHQPLPIDGEDHYRLSLRIRVPLGSDPANDGCRPPGHGARGHGLHNLARLTVHQGSGETAEAPADSQESSACIATPMPRYRTALSIDKDASTRSAEVGDLLTYRLRIRNTGEGPAIAPVVVDQLPAGFRLEPGSVRVQGAHPVEVQLRGPRLLHVRLDRVDVAIGEAASPASAGRDTGLLRPVTIGTGSPGHDVPVRPGEVIIHYRLRIGAGSLEGDGINRAHVECHQTGSPQPARCSNESRWKVEVRAGVFSEQACLTGQIFVDCNGNSVKDGEELGIPGVRLYLENGTWMLSDEHGRYSHCGLRPRTHVLKVDGRTLPRRSRLVTSSAQNAGDAHSLFIDARKGMLHRADFIEGSCSATVIEQVRARQSRPVQDGTTETSTQARRRFFSR